VQIQTASRYTLSASGSSSASAKAFVAEELSPIQSPDAANQFEKCGLAAEIDALLAQRSQSDSKTTA
jgi:uncharacterized protein YoaH (UPF0181 family)